MVRHRLAEPRLCLDDLPRIEARDIPDNGILPDGSKFIFGSYSHTIRGDQVMQRWMVSCPLCGRPCRVLYCHERQWVCRRCTGLPYRTAVSGRVERAAFAMRDPAIYQVIQARLMRDCEQDAKAARQRYRDRKTASQ